MPVTVPLDEFRTAAGRELPASDWMQVSQERVNRFADATEDHQFIHVDPQRASQTPFGGTIVHGYLTLSLLVHLNAQHALVPEDLAMMINYGSDKIRFLMPVPVGSRIRTRQKILDVQARARNSWLSRVEVTVEVEGMERPAMVAEVLMLHVLADTPAAA